MYFAKRDLERGETMRKGLVLEGGAMRGMFTAGVIDVMMENNILYDGIVGVSAGAVFGCNYKSGQIGRVIRYNERFSKDKRYCSLWSLLKTGDLYGADFCYREIPEKLDIFDVKAYRKNPMPFYVVCTDIETGEPIYKRCRTADREDLLWMRASASLPLVSRPVTVGGRVLLDGGMADAIPLRFFEGIGYTKNVVVLTRDAGYVKKPEKMQGLMRRIFKAYPALLHCIAHRHEMYNDTVRYIEKQQKNGAAFVIRPQKPITIKRTEKDPAKLREIYTLGRETMETMMPALRAFLEDHA